MNAKQKILEKLTEAVQELSKEKIVPQLSRPKLEAHGDYTSNVAMVLFKKYQVSSSKYKEYNSPMELAQAIVDKLNTQYLIPNTCDRVEVAAPGFINFNLSKEHLIDTLRNLLTAKQPDVSSAFVHKKIMVEYAHPNTHKEMHIGHMRTLIVGEALSRLYEACGAIVFRANYQGDIGPHVAKALYGIQKIMEEKGLTLNEIEQWSHADKAHFLGDSYVRGSKEYKEKKEEIDALNMSLYNKEQHIWSFYEVTRRWSLDYYDDFYKRFYTKFDKLFFESEMAEKGKQIVQEHVGDVFVRDQGAIVFKGEQYGLHTRVFVTSAGNPTYEGKEMANGFAQWKAFPFDKKIHVVGSEQAGYFQVVFKALELLDPEKFENKQHHVSMGMVQFADRKMSSRTGDILRVDWLIDEVKKRVDALISLSGESEEEKENLKEMIAIGAIKYSVLKVDPLQNVAFDIEKSLALDGDSGPYLQYTYARTQSVLTKVKSQNSNVKSELEPKTYNLKPITFNLEPEELSLLRSLVQFPQVVEQAAVEYAPNVLAAYLFDLAQTFNLFYQKHRILEPVIAMSPKATAAISRKQVEEIASSQVPRNDTVRDFRLSLTAAVGKILRDGLYLLGIQAPERM